MWTGRHLKGTRKRKFRERRSRATVAHESLERIPNYGRVTDTKAQELDVDEVALELPVPLCEAGSSHDVRGNALLADMLLIDVVSHWKSDDPVSVFDLYPTAGCSNDDRGVMVTPSLNGVGMAACTRNLVASGAVLTSDATTSNSKHSVSTRAVELTHRPVPRRMLICLVHT